MAGVALSLTGLVAAGLVFLPMAKSYLRTVRRVGGDGGALSYGGGGKPSRLPTSDDAHQTGDTLAAAIEEQGGGGCGGGDGEVEEEAMGGRAVLGRHNHAKGAADDDDDVNGAEEDGEGWTTQHGVSPSRAAEVGMSGGPREAAIVPVRPKEEEEEDEEREGGGQLQGRPLKPSVARAAIPAGLDEADHFRYKDVDL
jgi:hypothetical protein